MVLSAQFCGFQSWAAEWLCHVEQPACCASWQSQVPEHLEKCSSMILRVRHSGSMPGRLEVQVVSLRFDLASELLWSSSIYEGSEVASTRVRAMFKALWWRVE